MLKCKTYQLSNQGLENAISDRKHALKVRKRVLILIGAITLTTVLNIPVATVIAFKCI